MLGQADSPSILKITRTRRNQDFNSAIADSEQRDLAELTQKLRQPLSEDEEKRVGVSNLKNFLEQVLLREYMKHLPAIMKALKTQARDKVRENTYHPMLSSCQGRWHCIRYKTGYKVTAIIFRCTVC